MAMARPADVSYIPAYTFFIKNEVMEAYSEKGKGEIHMKDGKSLLKEIKKRKLDKSSAKGNSGVGNRGVQQQKMPAESRAKLDSLHEKNRKGSLTHEDEISVLDILFGGTEVSVL